MIFSEEEIIEAFKAFANPNDGWVYLDGVPESNAKLIIDYMKEHKNDSVDDEKVKKLINECGYWVAAHEPELFAEKFSELVKYAPKHPMVIDYCHHLIKTSEEAFDEYINLIKEHNKQ